MIEVLIREAQAFDYPTIVGINDAEVRHTSPMDMGRLHDLDQLAAYHRVAEIGNNIAAFLLAMRDNCAYQNENYAWFSSRFPRFLYVDRIVVDAKYAGLKIGTMLYQDLFDYARANDVPAITCEYNIIPPNEPSRVFHNKFGFEEMGTQWLTNGTKMVSLQAAGTGVQS